MPYTDDDKTPTGIPEPADLVAEARQKCLAANVLAETLVATMAEGGADERAMALAYSVEEHVSAACEAVSRAGRALL